MGDSLLDACAMSDKARGIRQVGITLYMERYHCKGCPVWARTHHAVVMQSELLQVLQQTPAWIL